MTLTLEMSDPRIEAVIRALDKYTFDRQEQAYTLRAALQWVETVAFTSRFRDISHSSECASSLGFGDIATQPPEHVRIL